MRAQKLSAAAMPYRSSATPYRSSATPDAIAEGLSLLDPSLGYEALKKHKPKHLRGPMTWTKIAEAVAKRIGEALVTAADKDEINEAAAHAKKLDRRLRQRDASRDGRVTVQTRELVGLVSGAAVALSQLAALIQDGSAEALARTSLDDGGRAIALRSKMVKLRERFGGSISYARTILEKAVGMVLASGAHAGVKSLYFKALEQWPAAAAPVDGTSVSWDDDDF